MSGGTGMQGAPTGTQSRTSFEPVNLNRQLSFSNNTDQSYSMMSGQPGNSNGFKPKPRPVDSVSLKNSMEVAMKRILKKPSENDALENEIKKFQY
jgi:hypothetical protein